MNLKSNKNLLNQDSGCQAGIEDTEQVYREFKHELLRGASESSAHLTSFQEQQGGKSREIVRRWKTNRLELLTILEALKLIHQSRRYKRELGHKDLEPG